MGQGVGVHRLVDKLPFCSVVEERKGRVRMRMVEEEGGEAGREEMCEV